MTPGDDPDELRRRATDDPASVEDAAVERLVEAHVDAGRPALDALRSVCEARPTIVDVVTTRAESFLSAADPEVRTRAVGLLVELAAGWPERVAAAGPGRRTPTPRCAGPPTERSRRSTGAAETAPLTHRLRFPGLGSAGQHRFG